MNNKQRMLCLTIVVLGSLSTYFLVALFTELNFNPRDPKYYEKDYTSNYNLLQDNKIKSNFNFKGVPINSTHSNATLKLGNTTYSTIVTTNGLWMNESATSEHFLIFWLFIENPVQQGFAGEENFYSKPEITVIDPFGIFGQKDQVYLLVFSHFYIHSFDEISNQVSNYYEVYLADSNVKIGNALYDTTCGLLWWFDIFDVSSSHGIKAEYTATTFLISRNRFWYTGTMLGCFVLGFIVFFLIAKVKQFEKEHIKEMVKFMIIGDLAFFMDGVLDIWYTAYKPVLLALDFVIIGLVYLFFKEHSEVVFIGLLEVLMCMVMYFFMGDISLVFTFVPGSIAMFFALSISIHTKLKHTEIEKKIKG
jgi:hypothetical protein